MNRLLAYRELEGLTQAELGDLLSISPQLVSAIESGRRSFTGDLGVIGYRPDRFELPEMSEPLHRLKASTHVSAKKRAKELLRLAGEVFIELREITDNAPRWTLHRRIGPETLEEWEDAALEVRRELAVETSGPIKNLTQVVERAGVCVVPVRDLDGVSGLSAWVGDVPVIGISPNMPGDRCRFTLSHELGHLLHHSSPSPDIEREANRFAGALLFPRDDFMAAMSERAQLRDFVQLKSSWGVAIAAIIYRAHELDYIDDSRYRALQIQMAKWRKAEPGSFSAAHGQLLPRLVEVNGGVTKVATRLGIKGSHLAELVDWRYLRLA